MPAMKESRSEITPPAPSAPTAWLVACAILGFLCAYRPLADMDFPWHLAMGEAMLEQGPRLDADPISYLDFERAPDMGAWLGETVFALAHSILGLHGVVLVVALVAATLLALVFSETFRATRNEGAAALAAAFAAACSIHRWRGRPDVFSILLFFVILAIMERRASARRRGLLFGLTLLWINLHPGAIVVPLLCLARGLGENSRRWTAIARARLLDALACAVALCLTPRGPLETFELVRLTIETGPLVPEWLPLWRQPVAEFGREWVLAGALVLFALWARPRRRLGLDLLGLALGLRSFRLLYMLTPLLDSGLARVARPRHRPVLMTAALLLVVAFPLADRWSWYRKTVERGDSPFVALYAPHYPVAAADFIERHRLEGRLFHPVAWGGYLGWRLAPRNRSAHDGRISLWGKARAEAMLDFLSVAGRERLRAELGFEILVVAPGLVTREELAALGGRWLAVQSDKTAAVFIDVRGPHAAANLARVPR